MHVGSCFGSLRSTGSLLHTQRWPKTGLPDGEAALIYAGAQKNIGPAGLTIVIMRRDLLDAKRDDVPTMLSYKAHADAGSMSNTPPTYGWYMAGLVFEWLIEQGGLDVMAQRNQRKAETLYGAVDGSDFYQCPVAPRARRRARSTRRPPAPARRPGPPRRRR